MVYQEVTRNSNLSAAAKGLYAYLSSFCGTSDECYPSVEKIIKEMDMGKDTFYRHINALVAAGVVEKHQTLNSNGTFGRTIYRLTHKVVILGYPNTDNKETEKPNYPIPDYQYTDRPTTDSKETNNNNILNNNIINNNNNIVICPEPDSNTNVYSLDTGISQTVSEVEAQYRLSKDIVRDRVSIELGNTVCPEPDKSALNLSGILLPLNDKSFYDVPQDKIDLWVQTYPAVDIVQELQKMRAWLDSNPTRRKTRRGINRFINSWLSRSQDSGRGRSVNGGDATYAEKENGRSFAL